MKLSRIIIALILSTQAPLCSAMQQPPPSFTIGTANTATYNVPTELVNAVTDAFTSRFVKDLGTSVPGWFKGISEESDKFIVKTTVVGTTLVSQLTHNMACICGGSVVGAIGAYLACQGIGRYFDPNENDDGNKKQTHLKLTALGLGIMAAAGLTVNAFLK